MSKFHEKISIWAFRIVIFISMLALIGWLVNLLPLAGMGMNSIPMAPVTILCFVLTSFVAMNLHNKRLSSVLLKSILAFIAVCSLLILFDTLTGYSIQLENIFGTTPGEFKNFPLGRMSPATSILFLFIVVSLLTITAENNWRKLAVPFAIIALLAAFTFDLGYLYRTPLLYGRNIIPPAWNTSLAFTFLSVGILSRFGMNDWPLNLFIGESVRARLMRGFLPLPLLIIIIAGWFDSISMHFFEDHVLGSALVTFFSLLVLSLIILKLAKDMGNDIDHVFAFRKEAEVLLRESELHFRTLADSGQALIWTSGIDKKYNYFNKPWLDFTGRSLEQELGDGWTEGVHPDDINRCFQIYEAAFDRHERFSIDYRLGFYDGSFRWIQDNGTPRFNTRGEFIGYIGHCLDITEYKLNENKIKESEEKYRSIFENSSVAILLTATDGSILSANNHACLLFGMTEQEICLAGRKGIIDLSDPRLPILLEERQMKGHTSGILTFTKKNGSKFEGEISSVVFTDSEKQKRTSMVIRDLTEQIQAESEIQELNKELGQKVKERTIELEQKNSDLERINKLFIGRELRMIELKNQLKVVKEELRINTGNNN